MKACTKCGLTMMIDVLNQLSPADGDALLNQLFGSPQVLIATLYENNIQ
jgi:hypothetical protein